MRTIVMDRSCILVIAVGVFGMKTMAASKRPQAEKPKQGNRLAVSAILAEEQTIRLTAMGYGRAEPGAKAEHKEKSKVFIFIKIPDLSTTQPFNQRITVRLRPSSLIRFRHTVS